MIVYNFRHRGPFEYDKFVLNALQLNNKVNYLLNNKLENTEFNNYEDKVNDALLKSEEESKDLYILLLNYRRY